MSFCFRRLYATLPKPPSPSSLSARTSSTPLQVRRRRLRKQLASSSTVSAPLPLSLLSPSERERYQRLKRLGALFRKGEEGFRELTEEEWLNELNEKRTRLRGVRKHEVKNVDTGKITVIEDVVGQRIYLPNIIFRMTRNFTPPGQPYNPWEATFRVPMSLTKLDIRSYLHAIYGVKCTYIRTDNYFKPIPSRRRSLNGTTPGRKSYKRAVVGLVEPFYYPEALEDMDREERQTREEWLQRHFYTKHLADQDIRVWSTVFHGEGNSWKPFNISGSRGKILKAVLARRQAREQATGEGAQTILLGRLPPATEEVQT